MHIFIAGLWACRLAFSSIFVAEALNYSHITTIAVADQAVSSFRISSFEKATSVGIISDILLGDALPEADHIFSRFTALKVIAVS